MLATARDDTWNMLNMQNITLNLKRLDYSDIPGGGHNRLKDPPTWLKVATTLEKPPNPHLPVTQKIFPSDDVIMYQTLSNLTSKLLWVGQ